MEPVTHILTGACLARTGFHRKAAYATAAMAVAAEFPDIDTLWSLRGPVSGFQHHRGITHTFIGLPFEAALLLGAFFVYHRFRRPSPAPLTSNRSGQAAPTRWLALYGMLLLALASHILLDYTNNYGVRPFFPFHDAWYAGSIVFIFDPLIFLFLLAGLLLPSLFGLIGQEVGASRERYRGRGWAISALVAIVLLWTARWLQHNRAVTLAQGQTLRAPATQEPTSDPASEPPNSLSMQPFTPQAERPLLTATRIWASPDPLSIFRWYTASDFGPAYTLGVADTRTSTLVPETVLIKPESDALLRKARQSPLGRVYLDWSAMPFLQSQSGAPEGAPLPSSSKGNDLHTVTLTDLRFLGSAPTFGAKDHPPLSGQVVLGANGSVLAEGMDGRFGH